MYALAARRSGLPDERHAEGHAHLVARRLFVVRDRVPARGLSCRYCPPSPRSRELGHGFLPYSCSVLLRAWRATIMIAPPAQCAQSGR